MVSTSLKSLQGTCRTGMLTLCQRCHDVRTMCFTKMICVLGNVVYITWRRIFVSTSGCGDHVGGGGPSGRNGAPQLRLGSIFIDIPFSV